MLRIISLNLNGIRSASTKGFYEWLSTQDADMVCVQELKAQDADITKQMQNPANYQGVFHYAQKRGYSGVGIFTRHPPSRVVMGVESEEFDAEGRYIQADFDFAQMPLSVISLYMPSGSSSEERQEAKFRFMAHFFPRLKALRAAGREVVICADWNIAHQEIDLKNWKSNQKNSGFLPEERKWMTQVLEELGWVDTYRRLHPDTTAECYTWWSNRGQAWANNVGWRLDYQLATPGIAALAKSASVYKEKRFSDHAPLTLDYDFTI